MESYFQESASVNGEACRRFEIAGTSVSLKSSGGWLSEMTPALSHLEVGSDGADAAGLTVMMWDGGQEPRNHLLRAYLFALTNWWFSYTGPRGELLDIHSESMTATYHPGTETLSLVDLERHKAFYWKRDTSPLPYYEKCSPFRSLLHSWMRSEGRYFVHGAAVGYPNGGVLLVGKGGSGKSTSALCCLEAGMHYAGDDYCILRDNSAGGYDAHSLYCTAKLVSMGDLKSFPAMSRHVVNEEREPGEKVAISLADYKTEQLIDHFPLRAVLVPMITHGAETKIVPCSARQAMMAIAPSSLAQLPASGKQDLEFLGRLARGIPCYQLLLGTGLEQIPEKIAELLRTLGVTDQCGVTAGARN